MQTIWSDGAVMIRPYRRDDVDALYEAARTSVDEVGRWLPWLHSGYTRDDSAAWIAARPAAWDGGLDYAFGIFDVLRLDYLGGCGLNTLHPLHNFANLGYWVRSGCTGRGVATAAARLVARFGFQELRLTRLEIVVAVGNRASLRVAEKLGAVREGVLRNRLREGDGVADAVMFSLIPEDLGLSVSKPR